MTVHEFIKKLEILPKDKEVIIKIETSFGYVQAEEFSVQDTDNNHILLKA